MCSEEAIENILTKNILEMLYTMITFGFFKTDENINSILPNILQILSGI